MKDVTHQHDVGSRNVISEEAATRERHTAVEPVLGDIVLEDGSHLGQIESHASEVWIGQGNLHREVALGGSDIDISLVVGPCKLLGDGDIAPMTDT